MSGVELHTGGGVSIGIISRSLLFVQLLLVSAYCGFAQSNPIVVENAKPGNPSSEWDIAGAGDSSIQGFATDISVNKGETIRFKVKTNATNYRLDIYRLGYYGGLGARFIATITPSAALPQTQPNPIVDSSTGLVDCGNWAESASWAVPLTATSGSLHRQTGSNRYRWRKPHNLCRSRRFEYHQISFSRRPIPPGKHTTLMGETASTRVLRRDVPTS